ncbi:unnamed protein product, partial [Meganyctiphanes norvegica]
MADSEIYNIDSEGKNGALEIHRLIDNIPTDMNSQKSASTNNFQGNNMNTGHCTVEENDPVVSNQAQFKVTTLIDDIESSKNILNLTNNNKETQKSFLGIKNTSLVTKDKKNCYNNFNHESGDINKLDDSCTINEISLGAAENNNSRDEPDFVRISPKINRENEKVLSISNGGPDLSIKFKCNSVDGIALGKESLSEPSSYEHSNEIIETISNKVAQETKPDKIAKGSYPSPSKSLSEISLVSSKPDFTKFPLLCDKIKLEETHMGMITVLENYNHFTMSILSSGGETILTDGPNLIAEASPVPNFEVTFGTLISAMSEKYQGWYRAYVMDQFEDGQTKVFFIDFGNIEVVKITKPLPDGILSQAAGLAVIAKRKEMVQEPEMLESIIKVENTVGFKVLEKRGTSMKVSLFNENRDSVGIYILRPWYTSLTTSSVLPRVPSNGNVKKENGLDKPSFSNSSSIVPTSGLKVQVKQEVKTNNHENVTGGSDESRKPTSVTQRQNKSAQPDIATIGRQS